MKYLSNINYNILIYYNLGCKKLYNLSDFL